MGELVTSDRYPELDTFELSSERGGTGHFVGQIISRSIVCAQCSEATAAVYRGPQSGLALDVPETPFTVSLVDLELTWCSRCGLVDMRLRDQDGTEHLGL